MSTTDYETLTYKIRFKRACKIGLIIILITTVVLAPALWVWNQSIQQRQTLREAKNVLLNMELLALEYYGFDSPIVDKGRESGMSEDAEAAVRSYSGADGDISLISWNTKKNCVTAMNYQKGKFLVQYRFEESDDSYTWDIYWNIRQYDNQK